MVASVQLIQHYVCHVFQYVFQRNTFDFLFRFINATPTVLLLLYSSLRIFFPIENASIQYFNDICGLAILSNYITRDTNSKFSYQF